MRSSVIIGIIAALVVIVGGVIWFNNTQTDRARLEREQTDQVPQAMQEPEATMPETQDPAPTEPETVQVPADEPEAVAADDAQATDEPIVVGDEITDDAIVVDAVGDEPTILDPEDTTSPGIVAPDETAGPGVVTEDAATAADTTADATAIGGTPEGADITTAEVEQLLTPQQFDRDAYLELISEADQLPAEEQSRLAALVEGAAANPAMIEGTVDAIRTALDLPPLN